MTNDTKKSFTGTETYIATDDLQLAVNAAMTLQKPLLIKGEPGTLVALPNIHQRVALFKQALGGGGADFLGFIEHGDWSLSVNCGLRGSSAASLEKSAFRPLAIVQFCHGRGCRRSAPPGHPPPHPAWRGCRSS